MTRTQIQLTDEQLVLLKKISARKGISVAELVRRGVDIVLSQETVSDLSEPRKKALAAAGKFRSGKSDVAEKHDKYLAEAYRS